MTFHIAETPSLPSADRIGAVSVDVGVSDMTDALLLSRLIVQAVNGNTRVEL
ncbi:hypothetical protein [Burkholderia cepacia]|uniref:hypothetical protein n=1 Tax=Burkholderia cepacia TaxID=292 RepID=UPI0026E0862C|nr:hypothetical protein [Burkholderia cepacia]MDO5948353.1 hypothetical protein [Burkholderia cepacia]